MKTKPKKPTLKEVSEKTNYLLYHVENIGNRQGNMLELLADYIDYKGDTKPFQEHIKKKFEEKEPEECSTPETTSKE